MTTFVTVAEAALTAGLSHRTILRDIESGRLPALKLSAGRTAPYLIERADLAAWRKHRGSDRKSA